MKKRGWVGAFLGFCFLPYVTSASELAFFELIVKDQWVSQDFYSRVLGWEFREVGADFALITNAATEGALLSANGPIKRGESVKVFFRSQNLSSTLDKVVKAGGQIRVAPTSVGGGTWIAEFTDPDGNWIGLLCKDPNACLSEKASW